MSSQEVVQRTPQQELMARLEGENVQKALAALLPENVTPDRFRRVFGTALMANPAIAEAEPNSIIRSLLDIAGMGLMPDGREAAIVVRQNRKKGIKEAKAQAMVAGVRKRFAKHGWTIRTQHVYANDEFEYVLVPEEDVARHNRVRPGAERGDLLYAYAVGTHRDGRRQVKVIDRDRAMAAKAKAQYTGPGSQWDEHEPAMWEKTAAHDFAKQVGLAEDDRIAAIFVPPASPIDAAVQMYGPNGRDAFVNRETGAIKAGSPPDVGGRPAVPSDGQQAEGVTKSGHPGTDSPSTPSAPDPDEDYPEEEADFTGQIPLAGKDAQKRAEDAGAVRVPSNREQFKDKTIAEVAALGVEGERYMRWMLRPERKWDGRADRQAILDAARTYAEIMLPDVWADAQKLIAEPAP